MRRALAVIGLVLVVGGCAARGPAGPRVEDPGPLPEPPKSSQQQAYDARLRASAEAAEDFQGPLDGGWTLAAASGGDLYAIELVDKRNHVEGAWRDLKREGDPQGSGLLDVVRRDASGFVLSFRPSGQRRVDVTLGPDLRGNLVQGGARTPVTLRRNPKGPALDPPPQGEVAR
ncbi:hypothetical protein LJR219_000320 [Phenylobacterium sp. LjRoot219]|uniref:hypothetical protein n=1 Tax=Phenylobacterium sp. LjRoot219 TaxID=3342283 RepID=UPI003ECE37C1